MDLRGTLFFFPVHDSDGSLTDFCLLVARKSEVRRVVEQHFAEAQDSCVPLAISLFCARQRNFVLEKVLGASKGVSPSPALISPRRRFVKIVQPADREEEISLSTTLTEKEDLCSESCKSPAPVPVSQLPPYGLRRIQIHSVTRLRHLLQREDISVELVESRRIGFAFPERNERPFAGPDFFFARNKPLAIVLGQEVLAELQPNVFRKIRPPELPYVVYGIVHELPFFWTCDS